MREAIAGFAEQFRFEPKIENAEKLKSSQRYIIAGMGGSHLAADLLLDWQPSLPVLIHCAYDLPPVSEADLASSLEIESGTAWPRRHGISEKRGSAISPGSRSASGAS